MTYDPWLYRWRHEEDGNGDQFWFSVDYGPVHVAIVSSEHETKRQWAWLEEDLKRANKPEQRAKVPWIILVAHHPMYNQRRITMSAANIEHFGEMLTKYKVSLFLCGHCHNYERTKPMNADGVTDYGDGSLLQPYIHEIFEPSAGYTPPTHVCFWSSCGSGIPQVDRWCSAEESNCAGCKGVWCPYTEPGPAGGSGERAQWGTIHMIIGMGGRRGDQCAAQVRIGHSALTLSLDAVAHIRHRWSSFACVLSVGTGMDS